MNLYAKILVLLNSHGLVGVRQKENVQDFSNPLIVVYFDVDYQKNPKGTNYWRNRVLKVFLLNAFYLMGRDFVKL